MLGLGWKPLNEQEEYDLVEAIRSAEENTSGEIRVHIDKWCKTDPVFKAKNLFINLGMEKTVARNGVLIYIAKEERKIAIVGDKGISDRVSTDFWDKTYELMRDSLAKENFTEGIKKGIHQVGVQLKELFPREENDEDELPNTISYG